MRSAYFRRALRIDRRALGPNHPQTGKDVQNLAAVLRETGQTQEAAELEQEFNGKKSVGSAEWVDNGKPIYQLPMG